MKTLTYSKIVNEIDEHTRRNGATLIDGLILECGKAETFDALNHIASVTESKSLFNSKTYWVSKPISKKKSKAINRIIEVLIRLYPAFKSNFEYLLKAVSNATVKEI